MNICMISVTVNISLIQLNYQIHGYCDGTDIQFYKHMERLKRKVQTNGTLLLRLMAYQRGFRDYNVCFFRPRLSAEDSHISASANVQHCKTNFNRSDAEILCESDCFDCKTFKQTIVFFLCYYCSRSYDRLFTYIKGTSFSLLKVSASDPIEQFDLDKRR